MIEMFRQLRTNIQFMIAGKKNPVILVTSSISGEGKSFISANLALSLALLKKKVVVIGLDIRNPMLGEYFGMTKDEKGMTTFLSNPDIKLSDIITESSNSPNLSIIQAGPVPPNPTELLLSTRLEDIIAELKTMFDYIVIDSAPLGVISDTYQISRVADNTIFVSRQNYTPREWTTFINDIYKNNRLNGMSVVLNGTDEIDTYYGYNHKKYFKQEL
jgi:capsular exopolysaccharide synthesis family protein